MAEIKKITFGEASEDAEAPAEQTSSSFLDRLGGDKILGPTAESQYRQTEPCAPDDETK